MTKTTLLLTFCGLIANTVAAKEIDFNRDIRPILSENCFACHGFDEESRQAGLRLDEAESAYANRDGVIALKPGSLEESEAWARITSDDEFTVMPPPDSNLALDAQQKAKLKQWIEQGANYAEHWSFIPPKKATLPKLPAGMTANNEIDRFVFSKLAEAGLSPSETADRYTLIRRLSFDLTGLPPTAEEVEAFVKDPSPDAYEKLVDRLLGSQHFGERMALDWLDAARYADTNGYSIDGGRHMWLWRDWIIHAFNQNKPYNEFLLEQIAGDLLPNATTAQMIASGFQRNNMVTHEGGTIPAENLTNYNADRVKTLGEAILGLTVACAQCHDHKYDPITQKDYYSLFAYFNTLSDQGLDGNSGVNPRPYLRAKTVLQTGEEAQLRQRIAKLEQDLQSIDPTQFAAWESQQQAELAKRGERFTLTPLKLLKVSTPNRGGGFEIEHQEFVRITQPSRLAAYDVSAELPKLAEPMTGLRVVFYPADNTPVKGWGYGRRGKSKGTFTLTALSVSVGEVPADQVDLFRLLDAQKVTANTWMPNHRPELCLDTRNQNGWSPEVSHDGPVHVTTTFASPISAKETPFLTTQLNFGAGNNFVAARMKLFAMTGNDDGSSLDPAVVEALKVPQGERTAEQVKTLEAYYIAHAEQTRRTRVDLANAQERLAVLTQQWPTMVMDVSNNPRPTFILRRGDYSQPTVRVAMNTPEFLPAPTGEQNSRVALARWLTMPRHPLTSRVYVNRVWLMMFGEGIVRTPADFGSQGEWPTHPDLLDWLAVDFVENGWDIKRLVKQIVMSATYRQSSQTSEQRLQRDPENRLLARGPRFRLPAEFIRDSALKVSGLLNDQLGGPSVNPYAPGDLWREISHYGSTPATAQTFVQDHGEKLYRRSLYTFWKRTSPPPNMAAFDAPNRETCVVSRPTTNTPLQALVLLNDVQFVEAARAFAERIYHREGDEQQKLHWAVMEALSRPVTDVELNVLQRALERERKFYQQSPAEAEKLLSVGESLRDRSIAVPEHAAWTQVAQTILNLSETVTRN